MPNIHHELIIGASAEKIYDALTSQEGLSAWWTPQVKAIAQINSIARFGFGAAYFKEMKMIKLVASQSVEWYCIQAAEEWIDTTISFELQSYVRETMLVHHPEMAGQMQQQEGDHATLLIFHHNNWKSYTPMFAECNYTWGRFLWSLKLYCETGKGLPWPGQHRVGK